MPLGYDPTQTPIDSSMPGVPEESMFGNPGMFDPPPPSSHTEITAKIGQPASQNPNPSSAMAMTTFGTIPKDFDSWIADPVNVQKIPQRPWTPQTGKQWLGAGLATIGDSIGAALRGDRATVGPELLHNVEAAREYDRNAPVMQQQANRSAYGQYLGQENVKSEINQRNMINPFYQKGLDLKNELSQLWQSGQVSPENYDKAVALKLQGNPYARLITPDVLAQIKQLPTQPPKFTVGPSGIEPIIYRGQNFGVTPMAGEPPEITQARQMAIDAQKQNETSKQDLKSGEFKPEVIAQLGKPPLNNPAAMVEYGKKAEAIETRMSAAPKLQVINAGMGDANSPEHQSLVNAVAHGDMQLSSAFPRAATPQQRAQIISEVKAANPNWKESDFDVTKKVREGFTSGADAHTLQAFNTAIKHMQTFTQMADALKNGDVQGLNKIGQLYNTQFGNDAATNFNIAKTAFSGEVGKAFAGANVGEGDRKELAEQISTASSPAQLKGAAATALMLLQGKREALQNKYNAGMQGQADFQDGSGLKPTHKFNPATGKIEAIQ